MHTSYFMLLRVNESAKNLQLVNIIKMMHRQTSYLDEGVLKRSLIYFHFCKGLFNRHCCWLPTSFLMITCIVILLLLIYIHISIYLFIVIYSAMFPLPSIDRILMTSLGLL